MNVSLNSGEREVLSKLMENPLITSEEMCIKTNFSISKIYRIYDKLKGNNYIERIGSRKMVHGK